MARQQGFTSRNKDGSPRKLRKATHPRAVRRQARKMKEMQLGRKLKTKEMVHHKNGLKNGSPKSLQVVASRKTHNTIHPGV